VPELRPIRPADFDEVVALNQRNVEALAPLDHHRLHELAGVADRADVVAVDGTFAGFVLTFAPGTSYDSENYRWFSRRYGEDFYYLDRIVLDTTFRRRGLGGFVYDQVELRAAPYHRLTLEVNLRPRNDASLAFHEGRGYVEVAQLGDDAKRVSLMSKELG